MKEYDLEDAYGKFKGMVTIIDQAEEMFEIEMPNERLSFWNAKELRISRVEMLINKHVESELSKAAIGVVTLFITITTALLIAHNFNAIKGFLNV